MSKVDEIVETIRSKFKEESHWIPSGIGEKELIFSVAYRPDNIRVELSNNKSEEDNSKNSISFKVENIKEGIEIVNKYFNLKRGSFEKELTQFSSNEKVDLTKEIYLTFFLLPTS